MPFFSSDKKAQSYLSDPDVVLMLKFQEGDKASFERLMEKYYKSIFNLVYRFLGTREIAEDLTQEVFIKIYKSAARYKPQAKLQTWIYQITKNISLNELRKLKRKTVSLDEPMNIDGNEVPREIADTSIPSPREQSGQKELGKIVQQAIASLPENQRMAVILRRYENLSYEDIAKTMGCSLSAVKSLLNRAKDNLREALKGIAED